MTQAEMDKELKIFRKIRRSPIEFVRLMWKLKPQPPIPEMMEEVELLVSQGNLSAINITHFQGKDENGDLYNLFERGKHITWQQWVILKGFEFAVAGKASKRITVRSGHGIGKSTTMSWLLLWFLFCNKNARIPCTAPSEGQLFDVLWAECSKWITMMPEPVQAKYEWQSKYIRIKDYKNSENAWYARARTARKENPEALAGLHEKYMLFLIDEASGVPEEVYNTAEGALTEEKAYVFMISNPTRTTGYFHRSHNPETTNNDIWQKFAFASPDSPIPSDGYAEKWANSHGVTSDEYKIRVLGEFPDIDAVDDEGYSPMLNRKEINEVAAETTQAGTEKFSGTLIMGIDPSGEGKDTTDWIIRDAFKAKVVLRKQISDEKQIARQTLTLMDMYDIDEDNIYVDMFGIGAKTVMELLKLGKQINGINVGDKPIESDDAELYLNIRARNYYGRLRKWIKMGGELVTDPKWKKELPAIRFRRATEQNSKIQIMSKRKMAKMKIASPNTADALMLTFCADDDYDNMKPITYTKAHRSGFNDREDNRYETQICTSGDNNPNNVI